MPQLNDLSRSLVALDQDSTIIAVVELSQSSWLVAGVLPGIERQPQKKLEPSAERLLGLLHRWRDEAVRAGPYTREPPAELECRADRPVARRAPRPPASRKEIGCHTYRATGITAYLANGGALEHAQEIAAHESPRTTKLYDRTKERLTEDEVERIRF